jgi:hypothetical protein
VQVFGDWDGRIDMCRKFAMILEKAAEVETTEEEQRLFSAVEFFSKDALTFRALAFFRVKQKWVDEQWIPGLDWMERCSDGDLLKWFGMADMMPNST